MGTLARPSNLPYIPLTPKDKIILLRSPKMTFSLLHRPWGHAFQASLAALLLLSVTCTGSWRYGRCHMASTKQRCYVCKRSINSGKPGSKLAARSGEKVVCGRAFDDKRLWRKSPKWWYGKTCEEIFEILKKHSWAELSVGGYSPLL